MSDDNEVSAGMSSELVQVLWETLAELYGSASVYPSDDIRRMAHDITTLRAERDALRAQLDAERDTFVDAHGTTWLRPTAEAYYLVYKARDKHQSELAKERERADAYYRVLECVSAERDALRAENETLRDAVNGKLFDKALKAFDENERLTAERDAERKASAAWRENYDIALSGAGKAVRERDALRATISSELDDAIQSESWDKVIAVRDRLDAALNKGETDE